MENLTQLFKLMELTRSQLQNGYVLTGIPKDQLSDLAQHHYLVAFIAWQLAKNANQAGANLNVEKVLEYALIHDLGELFGGDISMPYAKMNPKAKKHAKAFEAENQKFLTKFFGKEGFYLKKLSREILDAKSDEALVAKVADYMECMHYLLYVGKADMKTLNFNSQALNKKINKFKNQSAKAFFRRFVNFWVKRILKNNELNFIFSLK